MRICFNTFQNSLLGKKSTGLAEFQLIIQNLRFCIWSWLVAQFDFQTNKQNILDTLTNDLSIVQQSS